MQGPGSGRVATVDRSLMRGLVHMTVDTSRGCLALRPSMGLTPLRMRTEDSPDLRPASRLMHRRWGRGVGLPPFLLETAFWVLRGSALPGGIRGCGVGDGPDEAERLACD